jgi:hypothetical protein
MSILDVKQSTWNLGQEIGGQETCVTDVLADQFGCSSMKVDSGTGGIERFELLG